MADVTIITVCYHSGAVLPGLLETIPAGPPVIWVNNTQDDAEEIAALASDRVTVIQNDCNVGFGAACNFGAARATTEYLLFLNPDTRLSPGALDALMAAAHAHPDASAFNPILHDDRGRIRNKRSSILLPRGERLSRAAVQRDGEVPVLIGAALLVRRRLFEQVCGFDPNIFLYHEDDDLALRLAEHGPLRIVGDATVTHSAGHGSGDRTASAAIKAYHMGRSRIYTLRKHGRPFAFPRSVARALVQLAAPTTWFLRRKRVKQWHFLRGILSVGKDN
jgi:GT2 family glycosyltransferase